MTATPQTIADLAAELCDGRLHIERIPYWDHNRNRKHREHRTTLPGLLQQLAELMLPTTNPDTGHTPATSRPPGRWDAIAEHTNISLQAIRWCWHLGIELRDTTEANIRALVGASGNLDPDQRGQLQADMHRWYRTAAIVTEWQTPPAEVRAPCPALTTDEHTSEPRECKARTLRVHYATQKAYCATCGTTWDHTNIGLLAETVRRYEADTRKKENAA